MKENCSFNKSLIQEQSPAPGSPWVLLIEKCNTVCPYISEQMRINEYFLFFATGNSHPFARKSEIIFLFKKKRGAGRRILLFMLNQQLHKILMKVLSSLVSETGCFWCQVLVHQPNGRWNWSGSPIKYSVLTPFPVKVLTI